MKKAFPILLVLVILLTLALCGCEKKAEEPKMSAEISDGSFVIQIPVADSGLNWVADDMAQDDSVVKLSSADVVDDAFIARYDAAGDGKATVRVLHYVGIACDELHAWDLSVENGAVTEASEGTDTYAPPEAEQDSQLSGEWLEEETQFTQMTIEKNVERGWNVIITSPMTHGAYIFKATVYYDCDLDAFVYDKGKFFDLPLDTESELGEAFVMGTVGSFSLRGNGDDVKLIWTNDDGPVDSITFVRAEIDD
ncbi:MAG: hypothetical protein IJL15_02425 [Clostridia bacterium]|nr:hypothetical protein [Clostridia bacterium]